MILDSVTGTPTSNVRFVFVFTFRARLNNDKPLDTVQIVGSRWVRTHRGIDFGTQLILTDLTLNFERGGSLGRAGRRPGSREHAGAPYGTWEHRMGPRSVWEHHMGPGSTGERIYGAPDAHMRSQYLMALPRAPEP
jgi:hypothetical protein